MTYRPTALDKAMFIRNQSLELLKAALRGGDRTMGPRMTDEMVEAVWDKFQRRLAEFRETEEGQRLEKIDQDILDGMARGGRL